MTKAKTLLEGKRYIPASGHAGADGIAAFRRRMKQYADREKALASVVRPLRRKREGQA